MNLKILIWLAPLCLAAAGFFLGDLFDLLAAATAVFGALIYSPARRVVYQFTDRGFVRSLGMGAFYGVLITVVLTVVGVVVYRTLAISPDLSEFDAVKGNLKNALVLGAFAALYGGVIEEITYRGFLVGFGSSIFGRGSGVILVVVIAVLFGLSHTYQGVGGMIDTGLAGLGFGLVYIISNNKLLPAMTAHAVSNILGVAFIYFGLGPAEFSKLLM